MTETATTGLAVVEQGADNSLPNTEPALLVGAIVGIVGAVGSVLVIGGYIDSSQKQALEDSAGTIIPALFVIAAVVQAVITRMRAYAPRTAARIAIANSIAPAGAPPTLVPPP